MAFQPVIDMADRKAHDIEIGTLHARDTHIANPLLYTICPCFVKGHIFFYIVVNLLRSERAESHIRAVHESIV